MYNENLKQQFVQQDIFSVSKREVCLGVFNAFEEYEKAWGADLCTKTRDELLPVIQSLVGLRVKSKKTRLSVLKEYVKWCIDSNVPGACDGMLLIDDIGNEKIKSQTVSNPLHLQRYLDQVFDREEEKTLDCIYRCFYWLAYGGMAEEDIINVKITDVDFQSMIVRHNGEEFPIYREAIQAFRNCIELTSFVYKHPNYDKSRTVWKDRAGGDLLIRGIAQQISITKIRVALSRKSKKSIEDGRTDLKMSYYRVWLSGLFYRMYESERAGMPVDFSAAALRLMEGKTYKLDSGRNNIGAVQRRHENDYLTDYNRWKSAYQI